MGKTYPLMKWHKFCCCRCHLVATANIFFISQSVANCRPTSNTSVPAAAATLFIYRNCKQTNEWTKTPNRPQLSAIQTASFHFCLSLLCHSFGLVRSTISPTNSDSMNENKTALNFHLNFSTWFRNNFVVFFGGFISSFSFVLAVR